jgi:hypothetical protein
MSADGEQLAIPSGEEKFQECMLIFRLAQLPTQGADRSRTNRGLAKIEILSVAARRHVRSAKSFMLGMELECRHNQRTRLVAAARLVVGATPDCKEEAFDE